MPAPASPDRTTARRGHARWSGLAAWLVTAACAGSGTDEPAGPAAAAGTPAGSLGAVPGEFEDAALAASRELAMAAALHEGRKRGYETIQLTSVQLVDGVWHVWIRNEPGSVGGHGLVVVSQEGEVLSYRGGR